MALFTFEADDLASVEGFVGGVVALLTVLSGLVAAVAALPDCAASDVVEVLIVAMIPAVRA